MTALKPSPEIIDGIPRCRRECPAYRPWKDLPVRDRDDLIGSTPDACELLGDWDGVEGVCLPAVQEQGQLIEKYRELRRALESVHFIAARSGGKTRLAAAHRAVDEADPQ